MNVRVQLFRNYMRAIHYKVDKKVIYRRCYPELPDARFYRL